LEAQGLFLWAAPFHCSLQPSQLLPFHALYGVFLGCSRHLLPFPETASLTWKNISPNASFILSQTQQMNSLETGCLVLPHGTGHPVFLQAWPTPDASREGELQHRAVVWHEMRFIPDPGTAPSETLKLDLHSFIVSPMWTLSVLPVSG